MTSSTRLTRQGIRDLNHYGPKPLAQPAATITPKTVEPSTAIPAPLTAAEIVAPLPAKD